MIEFSETPLRGLFTLKSRFVSDERGSFSRLYCRKLFLDIGVDFEITQTNVSRNTSLHTLRGMHFQKHPFSEQKLVQCVQGAIYDVAIDLRPNSNTYQQYFGVELTPEAANGLYIPDGFAHGFITLTDNAHVLYHMGGAHYEPSAASGVRWNDPIFNIDWPAQPAVINQKDLSWGL